MSDKHTAAPWVGFYDQGKPYAILPAMRPGEICTFAEPFPSEADANFIVRAVNCHAKLIVALQAVRNQYMLHVGPDDIIAQATVDLANEALAAADAL